MTRKPLDPSDENNSAKASKDSDPIEVTRRIRRRPVDPVEPSDSDAADPAKPVEPSPVASPAAAKRNPENWNEDGSYNIGRGKTPTKTRWKPGQSGNPRGPKKVKADLGEVIIDTMEQPIALTSAQGRKVKMTQAAALVRKLYEKAVKGDLKTAQYLLDYYAKAQERRAAGGASDSGLTAAEDEMLQNLLRGLGRDEPESAPA